MGIKPNAVLVFIVIFAIFNNFNICISMGIFGGVLQDVISGKSLWIHTLLSLIIVLLVQFTMSRIYYKNNAIILLTVGLMTTIYNILFLIINFMLFNDMNFSIYFSKIFLIECIYNSIFSIIIYAFLKKGNILFDVKGQIT